MGARFRSIIRLLEFVFLVVIITVNLKIVFYHSNNNNDDPDERLQFEIRRLQGTVFNATKNQVKEDKMIHYYKQEQNVGKELHKNDNNVDKIERPVILGVHNMENYFDNCLKLGKATNKKKFVTFGIPTVRRSKAYYVIKTVRSLLDHMLISEKNEVVIVIFIADQDEMFIQKVIGDTNRNFPQEVSDGIIQVVVPDKKYYPDMNKLPRMYGDKIERVKWRSKQCLDYSYLYYYSKNLAEYFVQLEDDIIAEDGFIGKMKEFIKKNENKKWSVIEFGMQGFIGMTYKSENLESLSKFVRFFFWTMPVDWLFRYYNDIYLHKNSKDFKIKPPVFKHIGKFSSLKGQVRVVISDARRRFQSSEGNPEAKISSTMTEFYLENVAENPYGKADVMWAKKPKTGDTIDILFSKQQNINRIVFASGTKENKDTFHKTKLYVSNLKEGENCANYQLVGQFEKYIDHKFTFTQEFIWCVRLELELVRNSWLFLEEIAIL